MAQGNYGTESSPLADLYSEQIQLTPRTSDPSSTSEGDMWLRTDLDSGDKLATVKFDDGGSGLDVSVFPTGSSDSGVEEVLRIQTPNGEGFIPITTDSNAAFSKLALQHTGSKHLWHDSATLLAMANSFGALPSFDPIAGSALAGAGADPVITASHVTDRSVDNVADPQLFYDSDGTLYMFYEAWSNGSDGVISYSSSSNDGQSWSYGGTVLNPAHHVALPNVFYEGGEYYMVPHQEDTDSDGNEDINLYKFDNWPSSVTDQGEIIEASEINDPVYTRWNGRHWIFAEDGSGQMVAYYADSITGTWTAHPNNPITSFVARPCGTPVVRNSYLWIPTFDTTVSPPETKWVEITTLTTTNSTTQDGEVTDTAGGPDWRFNSWHCWSAAPVSPNQYVVAVDGNSTSSGNWAIHIYGVDQNRMDAYNGNINISPSGYYLQDGFDNGYLDPTWTASQQVQIVSHVSQQGDFSLRVAGDPSGSAQTTATFNWGSDEATGEIEFHQRVSATSSSHYMDLHTNGGTNVWRQRIGSNGFEYYDGSSWQMVASASADTWYKINLVPDWGNNQMEFSIDDTVEEAAASFRNNASGVAEIGFLVGVGSTESFYDEVSVST